jgi:F-type H+-transporting ATPase subunit b
VIAVVTASGDIRLRVEETEPENELIEGTEGGHAEDEAHNPILPETSELFYAGFAFIVLFVLMYLFAFPAVKKAMEGRTQRIRDNLDEAERTKSEAQRVLDEYQRQLADARSESQRIIEEARQTAEQMRRDLIARAEAEAAEMRERNRAEIEGAQSRAMADLRAQVSGLAIELAEKVVERNLDRDTSLALIESYINQVGNGARS